MRGYFFVFKRTLKSGNKIYYYQAYKSDGTLSTAKSTGCSRKKDAVKYCETMLMEPCLWKANSGSEQTRPLPNMRHISLVMILFGFVQDKLSLCTKDHPAICELYLEKLQGTKGVAYPAINGDRLYKAPVPTPPIEEQHRIVEKLNTILPIIDLWQFMEQRKKPAVQNKKKL